MTRDTRELSDLIDRVRLGELGAYGTIVRSFQDMAVGYAYAILGDFHLAEDAAQEAFVTAYLDLSSLREPAAFAGWLRRIVFKQCDRITRRKEIRPQPVEATSGVESQEPDPSTALEERELRDAVLSAIQELPEHEREATTLFYINGYSQNEIGEFLGVEPKTIRSRLYSARNRLRERMMDMVKEHLHGRRPSRDEDFTVSVMGDLADLTDQETQMVLMEFGVREIAIALQGQADEVSERVFANMSERVRSLLEDQTEGLGAVSEEESKAVRDRMVEVAQRAVAAGRNARVDGGEGPSVADVTEKLRAAPFPTLSAEGIAELIRDMATIAKRNGILDLEAVANAIDTDEEMLTQGIRFAVDGTEPALIQALLDVRSRTLVAYHETRYQMVVEGILSIRWNDHPFIANQRLKNCYVANAYGEPTRASLPDLRGRLARKPASQLDLEGLRLLIVDMAFVARREKSVTALAGLLESIDEDLLVQGLNMAIAGEEEGWIRRALETRVQRLLHRHETRYRLVSEGIALIQNGCEPDQVVGKLWAFYAAEP